MAVESVAESVAANTVYILYTNCIKLRSDKVI